MKQKILLLVFTFLFSKALFGQVSGTSVTSTLGNFISGTASTSPSLLLSTYTSGTLTTRLTIIGATGTTLGFVGIGISPSEKLHVSGGNILTTNNFITTAGIFNTNSTTNPLIFQTNTVERMRNVNSGTYAGNVGIGVTNPLEMLHINGSLRGNVSGAVRISSGFGTLDIGAQNTVWAHFQTDRPKFYFQKGITVDEGIISSFDEPLTLQAAGVTAMTILTGGNIGIGTIDPKGYKLAVAGKIISEEVVVKLQANWPDYVFESTYMLPSLSELENFIITNKHLPGVPTTAEVKENGLSVGQMNAILLKKVEELTLYMINQEKEKEIILQELNSLQIQLNQLEKRKQ